MFGLIRKRTHELILNEVLNRQREIHDDLMMGYIRQVDGQMMRLRQIQNGEIDRLGKQVDRLAGVGQDVRVD